jgi:tetratricopeptide (TPR) repeat protein
MSWWQFPHTVIAKRSASTPAVYLLALLAVFSAHSQTANELLDAGKLAEAEAAARADVEAHPDSADAHYLLGYILFKQNKPKDSLAEYTSGAKYRTPSAHDLEVVGADYVLLGDYRDADKWFTKSVQGDPNNLQALYYLGRAKYNENRFEEAVAVFLKCLQRDPRDIKAEDNLGLSYEGLGRTDDAIAAYRAALAWQADAKVKNSDPYINLGNILVETDRSEEAIPYLTEAVRLSPDALRAHRALGKAYLHAKQLDKAQAEFETCIQIAPQNAPSHFMLAQVYRKRGLLDKARLETQRYSDLSGTHSTSESSQ